MTYPIFRKYNDGLTYFKITSDTEFQELKRQGKYYSLSNFKCKIYPDRVFMNDLIACSDGYIIESNESEFLQTLKTWSQDFEFHLP
jgi:hypothetical protein